MFDSRTDPLMDRFIADLVEGAERNSRANGGPGVNVLVHKFAGMIPGLGGPLTGAAIGGGIGGLAGLLSGDDHPLRDAAIGAGLGGVGGHLSSELEQLKHLAGAAASPHVPGPNVAGMGLDRQMAAFSDHAKKMRGVQELGGEALNKLSSAATSGAKTAAARFGVKEAFLPALMAGAARLAPMAGKALGFFGKNPIGQQIAGTAASGIMNHMMQPKQQPQPQGMMG